MKNTVPATLLFLSLMMGGCLKNDAVTPKITIEPIVPLFVSRDSITNGDYLGLEINSDGAKVYSEIQALKQKGVFYVNIVGNISSDLSTLADRLPLYNYILLDEKPGTDSGVQINLVSGKVTGVYLNSGAKLSQWPLSQPASSSVRPGDKAEDLYGKLVKVHNNRFYANKFEYISLLTKDLSTAYDPDMAVSPQWYLRYQPGPGQYEDVKIYLENGKVKYLEVSRYKDRY